MRRLPAGLLAGLMLCVLLGADGAEKDKAVRWPTLDNAESSTADKDKPADTENKETPKELPTLVGPFGEIDRWEIRGAKAFSPDVLRDALRHHMAMQIHTHPRAPLVALPYEVRSDLFAAYQAHGFPSANISASFDYDAQRLVIDVHEGPRFHIAGVRVVGGGEKFDRDALAKALTEPCMPVEAVRSAVERVQKAEKTVYFDKDGARVAACVPVWRAGEDVNFYRASRDMLSKDIKTALAEAGYPNADFQQQIQTDPLTGTATLLVTILDAGPEAHLAEVVISGNKINSKQEILDYLHLKPGDKFTSRRQTQAERDLWQSGRFLEYAFTRQVRPADKGIELHLAVLENDIPPLSKPLTDTQQAILRYRDWLAGLGNSDHDDLLLSYTNQLVSYKNLRFRCEAVLGGARGSLIEFYSIDKKLARADELPTFALLADSDGFALLDFKHQAKLASGKTEKSLRLMLGFTPDRKKDGNTCVNLSLGFNYGSDCAPESPPLTYCLQLSPAAFIYSVQRAEAKCTLANGVLTCSDPWGELRIDAATGRLIEGKMDFSEVADGIDTTLKAVEPKKIKEPRPQGAKDVARIVTKRGAFEVRRARLVAAAKAFPNQYSPQRPVSSLASYLLADPLELLDTDVSDSDENAGSLADPKTRQLLRKLLDRGALAALDKWLLSDRGFGTYLGAPFVPAGTDDDVQYTGMDVVAGFGAQVGLLEADRLFRRGSWPNLMLRVVGFLKQKKNVHMEADTEQLASSQEFGPLCYLAGSVLLTSLDTASSAGAAKLGLKRLTTEGFRRDLSVLLDNNSVVGRAVTADFDLLRTLDDDDAAQLGKVVLGRNYKVMVELVATLRQEKAVPSHVLLPKLLAASWDTGLHEVIQQQLESLAAAHDETAPMPPVQAAGPKPAARR